MTNSNVIALQERREQTERLRQTCVTATGTGACTALRSAYHVPPQPDAGIDALVGKLKRM